MRIVHLSDIHLSKGNIDQFRDNVREALINDLILYNNEKKIDVIVITGDLLDKGGYSLLENTDEFQTVTNPFEIFKDEFITPISTELGLSHSNFLFVPGNHDIDERSFSWYEERYLSSHINSENINSILRENIGGFRHSSRIKNFKNFEKKFHENTLNYSFSENESIFFYEFDGKKIGFILINDSWRCKSAKFSGETQKLFFGSKQIQNGIDLLNKQKTIINICLFHHSIEDFEEQEYVTKLLINKDIELFLYGHYHKQKLVNHINTINGCYGLRVRAGLNKPSEQLADYQPGYQIIDLNLTNYSISNILFRKYSDHTFRYIEDTDTSQGLSFQSIQLKKRSNMNRSSEHLDISQFNTLSK